MKILRRIFSLSLKLAAGLFLLAALRARADAPAPNADVAAKKTRDDILFRYSAPGAAAVYLAGDFNNWADANHGVISDAKYVMIKGEDDVWKTEMALSPGKHSYKFVVNGNQWETDPNAPDKDADGNSVVEVK